MKAKIIMAAIIAAFFCMHGCGDDGPGSGDSNLVFVMDDINQVTTWSADSVYIIKVYDFYVNNSLSIEAGTVIKFHPDGPYMMVGSGGTIIANGTADQHIVFTSWKDDDHGGDSNEDGEATMPARKDWNGINTNDNNGSIFNYCDFFYGGNSSYSYTLETYGDNIQVTNCTFAFNAGDDETGWYGALDGNYAGSGCTFTGNVFYDNIRPFSVSTAVSIDNSNRFSHPDDASRINDYNGIFIESVEDINTAISWEETEVPFVIDDNDLWIESGASLTLGDNVCIKFRPDSEFVLDDNNAIVNHGGTGVTFTSYKDDSVKGDTNGDGSITAPGPGDWGGIYDNISSQYMNWANIFYSAN